MQWNSNKKIAIVGASSAFGRSLARTLAETVPQNLVLVTRNPTRLDKVNIESVAVGAFDVVSIDQWKNLLFNADIVFYVAGLARRPFLKTQRDYKTLLYGSNVKPLISIINACDSEKRPVIVYLSSIKIYSETTKSDEPISLNQTVSPETLYGASKLEAEKRVVSLCNAGGIQYLIVRSPLIVGPSFYKSGLLSILKFCVQYKIPLPFNGICNKRSYVAEDDLKIDILTCLASLDGRSGVIIPKSTRNVSTSELVKVIAADIGKRAIFFKAPKLILNLFFRIFIFKKFKKKILLSSEVESGGYFVD